MFTRIVRRVVAFALSALAAAVLAFLLLAVLPGDVARAQLGIDASDADVARLRAQLGLDRPLLVRLGDWLGGLLHGDLGTSYATQTPVAPQVLDAAQVTLILVLAGLLVAWVIALVLGTLAGMRPHRPEGVVAGLVAQVGISVPSFLAGLLLVIVFAVRLGWLPAGGWTAPADGVSDFLAHLALPALALGLVHGSVLARWLRGSVRDVAHEDFLRTARAVGLTAGQAMWRHGMRSALVPVIAASGAEFASLVIGAVVIEQVFVIPGLGSLLLRAVGTRDLAMIQAIVLVVVVLVLLVNLLVDVLQAIVDPRLRERA
jgi:peptide/nickel transport system permease protein